MFDRNYLAVDRSTSHHTKLVDPSVEKGAKHLDKVQKEAEKRVTEVILDNVPGFDAGVVRYARERRIDTLQDEWRVAFKLNGQRFDERITINSPRGSLGDREAQLEALHAVATAITAAVMTQLTEAMFRNNDLPN